MPEREQRQAAPARAFWSGTITFGLVSIPVDLFSGVHGRRTSMRMVDAKGHPLGREYYSEESESGLSMDDIVRAYETDDGPGVFRLTDHMKRLANSAQIMMMPMPYSVEELIQAVKDTVASTGLDSWKVGFWSLIGSECLFFGSLKCVQQLPKSWHCQPGETAEYSRLSFDFGIIQHLGTPGNFVGCCIISNYSYFR